MEAESEEYVLLSQLDPEKAVNLEYLRLVAGPRWTKEDGGEFWRPNMVGVVRVEEGTEGVGL